MKLRQALIILTGALIISCSELDTATEQQYYPDNVLNYHGDIIKSNDRSELVFSDQGAWFGYSIPTLPEHFGGFSGPFLMTQENGKWISPLLSQLKIKELSFDDLNFGSHSYSSHLEQVYSNDTLAIKQKLFFADKGTAYIITEITNNSSDVLKITPSWIGKIILDNIQLLATDKGIEVHSAKSDAVGLIRNYSANSEVRLTDSAYSIQMNEITIQKGETEAIIISHSFYFPEWNYETGNSNDEQVRSLLADRILGKQEMLGNLYTHLDTAWNKREYKNLVVKTMLTLQNNWRSAAGELHHSGLFPSYNYIWFHGFWAWDSWKHAAALAHYQPELAKNQVRAMYDFITADGFIPDCVYRDTTIENHNYRNTKPPLSGWAVWSIFSTDHDIEFLQEMYPKIKLQHEWWYTYRDHDMDGLCEYGSTDGTIQAAKWESGMDNAVRFDSSKILKNDDMAYSLNQESIDLNAYLYAEKIILSKMAKILGEEESSSQFKTEAEKLAKAIQNQFFDPETGWFYDTTIDGKEFVKIMGCEGWIPLWAQVATFDQAKVIRNNMMKESTFNVKVPLQTLSAEHQKFKPVRGYWRGPNWMDQAYFGVMGLRNYEFDQEANQLTFKLIHNAEGVLEKGPAIRENYQPISGEGMESYNFSWSAAHYLLLLLNK